MTIYFKQLALEERATWGTCPVCEAQHGEACLIFHDDIPGKPDEKLGLGAHTARLFNAPQTAAIDDKQVAHE